MKKPVLRKSATKLSISSAIAFRIRIFGLKTPRRNACASCKPVFASPIFVLRRDDA